MKKYQWLTVEDDGNGNATGSHIGGFGVPSATNVVAKGSQFHQDLVGVGWRPIWVRQGKSVWTADDAAQAISDYWLLIETRRINKEKQ